MSAGILILILAGVVAACGIALWSVWPRSTEVGE